MKRPSRGARPVLMTWEDLLHETRMLGKRFSEHPSGIQLSTQWDLHPDSDGLGHLVLGPFVLSAIRPARLRTYRLETVSREAMAVVGVRHLRVVHESGTLVLPVTHVKASPDTNRHGMTVVLQSAGEGMPAHALTGVSTSRTAGRQPGELSVLLVLAACLWAKSTVAGTPTTPASDLLDIVYRQAQKVVSSH